MANDPTFETELHAGSITLVKADLGIKRVCPSCAARFYDLQKRPIECPKCAFTFEPEALYKQRRPRPPEAQPAAVEREREEAVETEEEAEEIEAVEADEVSAEGAAVIEAGDEDETVVEEETDGPGMSVVEPDAKPGELEGIEEEEIDETTGGDQALLEEVEEEEDDVSGIIDADIEKDER